MTAYAVLYLDNSLLLATLILLLLTPLVLLLVLCTQYNDVEQYSCNHTLVLLLVLCTQYNDVEQYSCNHTLVLLLGLCTQYNDVEQSSCNHRAIIVPEPTKLSTQFVIERSVTGIICSSRFEACTALWRGSKNMTGEELQQNAIPVG